MHKKKIEIKIDPEELEVESRVKDIMGPAQHLDGSKPSEEEIVEMTDAGLITEKADAPVQSINQRVDTKPVSIPIQHLDDEPEVVGSRPETPLKKSELEVINEKLNEQIEDGLAELDLVDMGESDVDTTQEIVAKNRLEQQTNVKSPSAVAQELLATKSVDTKSKTAQQTSKTLSRLGRIKKIIRYGFLALIIIAVTVLVVPTLRASVLTMVGVRSSVLVKVVDDSTTLPLEGVLVSVDGRQAKTDANGVAKISEVRLGEQTATIKKSGFYPVKKTVTVDVRVSDLGEVSLRPSGEPYTYVLKDYVSGAAIAGVTLKSGDLSEVTNKDGKTTISLQQNSEDPLTLAVSAKGYRTETITPPVTPNGPIEVRLVPDKKHVYVVNQNNRYDVYVVDIDGKDPKLLLEGTGRETSAISALMSPDNSLVALVSGRDDKKNSTGALLDTLTIVDIAKEEATVIEHAEQIQLLGWQDDTLVYKLTTPNIAATSDERQKLQAYSVTDAKRLSLAKANNFTSIVKTSNGLQVIQPTAGDEARDVLQQISYQGEKTPIATLDIVSVARIDYNKFAVQTPSKLFEYTPGSTTLTDSSATNVQNRRYIDSPDKKTSVWVATTSSQSTLVVRTIATGKEKLHNLSIVPTNVLWWIGNNGVVMQATSNGETADYIVSTRDGKAQKITTTAPLVVTN